MRRIVVIFLLIPVLVIVKLTANSEMLLDVYFFKF